MLIADGRELARYYLSKRNLTGLMAEVGEALVATAIGLLVALPAVAAYNFFQRVIKARITRADALGKDVLAFLQSKRRHADAAAE